MSAAVVVLACPRGFASVVFAVLLVEAEGTLPHENVLLTTVFFTIGLSVLLHGLTAAPLACRYAAWFAAHPRADSLPVESGQPVREVRWRLSDSVSSPVSGDARADVQA